MRTKTRKLGLLLTWLTLASLSLSIFGAFPVWADNSVSSSIMIFEGELTDVGGGVYSGVLPMVDEAAEGLGDGESGYDVYARNGATAWFGNDSGGGPVWTSVDIGASPNDHDAWSTWDPDTPDWYQYSLSLYLDDGKYKWAVRNHPGASASVPWSSDPASYPPKGVPMSGSMDWTSMYAYETDIGAYLPGTGISEIPGGAADMGGGSACWDMDWSWGSEVVPLEYPGFDVDITDLGGGTYRVTLTPAQAPIVPLGFYHITHNNGGDVAVGEAQLFVNVESVGGQVLFTFYNTGPAASSIAQVYFDDAGDILLGIAAIDNTSPGEVWFLEDTPPLPVLPGGNGQPYLFSTDFSVRAHQPRPRYGVNPDESLGILFDLEAGKTFADVLADLASEALRIGIHVQAFSSGGSESFINTPPNEQPEPEYGTIIIIKDADPADGTDFEFTGDLGDFILDDAALDDNDGYSSSKTVTGPDLQEGTYSVAEVIPGGDWELASIACSDPSDNTTVDLDEATATINLDGTETVICLFTNAKLTAIELASFTVKSGISSARLAWETGTEVDNVGFNLYRATAGDGSYTKINADLIAAEGDPVAGASYSFSDKGLVAGTYYYQLEDIDLNGTTTLHGPVSVTVLPSLCRPSYRPAVPW